MRHIPLPLLVFLIVLTACRRSTDEPLPLTYPDLRITSLKLAGIPDEAIRIDQPTRTIRVRMPALLPASGTPATVTLTDRARLTTTLAALGLGQIARWCVADTSSLQRIFLTGKDAPGTTPLVQYTIRPEAGGPLAAGTASTPMLPFAIGDSATIHLPVQYLYGNSLPQSVTFTPQASGGKPVVVDARTGQVLTCSAQRANYIDLSAFGLAFEPGLYTVTMTRADGTVLTEPGALDVKAGRAQLDKDPVFGYTVLTGKPTALTVTGANLLADQLSFRVVAADGATVGVAKGAARQPLELTVPALAPGYYGLDLVQNGQSTGTLYRLSVLRTPTQPYIGMVNYVPGGKALTATPLALPRNQAIVIAFGNRNGTLALTLANQANPAQVYRLPLSVGLESYPKFTIPDTVPAGRYQLLVQQLDPATQQVLQSSEPFERPIELP